MNAIRIRVLPSYPTPIDDRAENEKGQYREDRADALREIVEPIRDVVLGDAEGDPADEGRDQPVAKGDVGKAERQQPEAEREDALVDASMPPAGAR